MASVDTSLHLEVLLFYTLKKQYLHMHHYLLIFENIMNFKQWHFIA